MMPLDEHYDYGFGATGEAFFRAAHLLKEHQQSHAFFEHLPENYLLRHAIELFLKSGIVIIHRKLKIPFSDKSHNSPPMVLVDEKWMPFHKVHSVADLYAHWKFIIERNADTLKMLCEFKPDWTVESDLDASIDFIEITDPNSTYYRYPINRNPDEAKKKSAFKRTSQEDLLPREMPEGKKVRAFIVENESREFVRAYSLDEDSQKQATDALVFAAEALFNYHAMMRIELTEGW